MTLIITLVAACLFVFSIVLVVAKKLGVNFSWLSQPDEKAPPP